MPLPVVSEISKRLYRHISQSVCPWNQKFSCGDVLPQFEPRPWNVNPDPAELVALTDEEFRTRYKNSPIKRTKLRGLQRNAAVARANREAGTDADLQAPATSKNTRHRGSGR